MSSIRSESANGQLRSLTLSVQDHVTILEGRKMGRKAKDARWVDALTVPGQFVGLCEGTEAPDADAQPTKVLAIASSPYDAKRNSAMLDAALVEVLVDRAGDEMETRLSQLAPGSLVHVTQVIGSGYVHLVRIWETDTAFTLHSFGTLFGEGEGLSVAMEEGHNLVMIGAGTQCVFFKSKPHAHQCRPRGLASLRACVEWTPVQAHASTRAVSLFILADSPQAVGFVKDFDNWRASGVRVHPIYCHPQQLAQNNGDGAALSPREVLEQELFPCDALGKPTDMYARACTVLMSGLTPDLMKSLTKQLIQRGVAVQRILCAGDL